FVSLAWDGDAPIELGAQGPPAGSSVHGGVPALADRRVFRRLFTLLRHILKEPFDAPEPGEREESSASGPLYGHLIEQLSAIEGSYGSDQEAVLRYDIEHVLRPYGFLPPVKGRPRSLRHGYAIGTALLSADQLLEVHALLRASLERLSDQSQQPLLEGLEDRLERAGLLQPGERQHRRDPKRALANRAFTEARAGTLAAAEQSQRVERAIRDRRRIWLRHTPDQVGPMPRHRGDDGRFRAWPLQLLFHNISWYLAFETDAIGREHGLIRTLRVDRLELLGEDGNTRRAGEAEHTGAMERLERLLAVCGGLYFGNDIDQQLAVMDRSASAAAAPGCYQPLLFSCTPEVFALIREEPRRFLPEHTAYSRPIPERSPWEAGPLDTLEPNAPDDSHPYRVRILLPRWTVQEDWDLRNWLFRWGARIRIEEPLELRELQLQQAGAVVALYSSKPL
ncbi:MAG: hypothetical protein VKI83_06775, partial [Synechococcaceae cyanobacterium]|nr:hypothetical protein [Synechococcaceae cyanobacterium]